MHMLSRKHKKDLYMLKNLKTLLEIKKDAISIRKTERISSLFISILAKSPTIFSQKMSQSDLNKIDDDSREFHIKNYSLKFEAIKECNVTKARWSRLTPTATLEAPQKNVI